MSILYIYIYIYNIQLCVCLFVCYECTYSSKCIHAIISSTKPI